MISSTTVSETVLVVDGTPSVLAEVSLILKTSGFTVLSASTPEEAIQISLDFDGTIDLLLTEYDAGSVWTRSRKPNGGARDKAESNAA